MAESTTTNVKFLKLTFNNSDNKSSSVQIPNPRADLALSHIETLMNLLIEKKFFEKNGVLLTKKKSAEIIERTVTTQEFDITLV